MRTSTISLFASLASCVFAQSSGASATSSLIMVPTPAPPSSTKTTGGTLDDTTASTVGYALASGVAQGILSVAVAAQQQAGAAISTESASAIGQTLLTSIVEAEASAIDTNLGKIIGAAPAGAVSNALRSAVPVIVKTVAGGTGIIGVDFPNGTAPFIIQPSQASIVGTAVGRAVGDVITNLTTMGAQQGIDASLAQQLGVVAAKSIGTTEGQQISVYMSAVIGGCAAKAMGTAFSQVLGGDAPQSDATCTSGTANIDGIDAVDGTPGISGVGSNTTTGGIVMYTGGATNTGSGGIVQFEGAASALQSSSVLVALVLGAFAIVA